jgi:hypothetical protein
MEKKIVRIGGGDRWGNSCGKTRKGMVMRQSNTDKSMSSGVGEEEQRGVGQTAPLKQQPPRNENVPQFSPQPPHLAWIVKPPSRVDCETFIHIAGTEYDHTQRRHRRSPSSRLHRFSHSVEPEVDKKLPNLMPPVSLGKARRERPSPPMSDSSTAGAMKYWKNKQD